MKKQNDLGKYLRYCELFHKRERANLRIKWSEQEQEELNMLGAWLSRMTEKAEAEERLKVK